jgi:hypothetical protein
VSCHTIPLVLSEDVSRRGPLFQGLRQQHFEPLILVHSRTQMFVSHAVSCSWKSPIEMAEHAGEEQQVPISIVPAPLKWKKRRSASCSAGQTQGKSVQRGVTKLSDHSQIAPLPREVRNVHACTGKVPERPSSSGVNRTVQDFDYDKTEVVDLSSGDICSSPPQSLPSLVRDSPRTSAWSDAESDDFFASPPPVRDLFQGIDCSPREKSVSGCVDQASSPGSRKITSHGVIPLRLPQKVRQDQSPAQIVQLWKSSNPKAAAALRSALNSEAESSSPPFSSKIPVRDKPPLRLQLPRIQTRFDRRNNKQEISTDKADAVTRICHAREDAENASDETLSPVALHQRTLVSSKSCDSLPDNLSKIVVPRSRSPTPGAIKILTSPVQAQLQRRLTGDDVQRAADQQDPVSKSQSSEARAKDCWEANSAMESADTMPGSQSLGTSPITIGCRNVGTAIQQAERCLQVPVSLVAAQRRKQESTIPKLVLSVDNINNRSRDPSSTWYDCQSGMRSAFSSDDGRSFLTALEGEGARSPRLPNAMTGRRESEHRHLATELEGRQIDASRRGSIGERASSLWASSDIYDTNSNPEEPWARIDTGVRDIQARKRMDSRAIEALRSYARKKRHEVRDQSDRASSPDAAPREQGPEIASVEDHTRSRGGPFSALATLTRATVLTIYIMFLMLRLGLWTMPCILLEHFERGTGRERCQDSCGAEVILRERKVLRRSSNRTRRKGNP